MGLTDIFTGAAMSAFRVSIDQHLFGTFTSIDGIGIKTTVELRPEGGNNDHPVCFTSGYTHDNLKLGRVADPIGAGDIDRFFTTYGVPTRGTASIQFLEGLGEMIPLLTYELDGVRLLNYSGPSGKVDGGGACTETLEFFYESFTSRPGL